MRWRATAPIVVWPGSIVHVPGCGRFSSSGSIGSSVIGCLVEPYPARCPLQPRPCPGIESKRSSPRDGVEELVDPSARERPVDELAEPRLVLGAIGLTLGIEPSAGGRLSDVAELRDGHREVASPIDGARAASAQVR